LIIIRMMKYSREVKMRRKTTIRTNLMMDKRGMGCKLTIPYKSQKIRC
jgi:hypothetical protein